MEMRDEDGGGDEYLHAATETKDRGSIDKDLHSTTEAEGKE